MPKTTDMIRIRPYSFAEAAALAEKDDVEQTRVLAAAIDSLKSLPVRRRRALYAKHRLHRGVRSTELGVGMGGEAAASVGAAE